MSANPGIRKEDPYKDVAHLRDVTQDEQKDKDTDIKRRNFLFSRVIIFCRRKALYLR
jgi:hypothetical protein